MILLNWIKRIKVELFNLYGYTYVFIQYKIYTFIQKSLNYLK